MVEGGTIETAPKDGTEILLYGTATKPSVDAGQKVVCIGYWTDFNSGGWVWHGVAAVKWEFWRPIPAPPKAKQ